MTRTLQPGLHLFTAAVALAAVGCGAASSIHPVRGRVVFRDGTPLVHGIVIIDTGASKHGSWGTIQPDGTFVMGSDTPDDGVPAGTWRVYVANAHRPATDAAPQSPPLVDARFLDPNTSGLAFTVPDQVDWEIVVDRPPAGRRR